MDFNNVLIGTDDPDRLVAYYGSLLGTPTFSEGGYTAWMVGTGGITVGPHSEVHGPNEQPGRIIMNITTADVPGDAARLAAAGAIVVREAYEFEQMPGTWIATFADPDGNYFQLVSPFEPSPS